MVCTAPGQERPAFRERAVHDCRSYVRRNRSRNFDVKTEYLGPGVLGKDSDRIQLKEARTCCSCLGYRAHPQRSPVRVSRAGRAHRGDISGRDNLMRDAHSLVHNQTIRNVERRREPFDIGEAAGRSHHKVGCERTAV